MHTVRSWIFLVAPLLLVGCSTMPPLDRTSGFIAGIPVEKSKLVVSKAQEVKLSAINSNLLPAGEYRPVHQDNTGVYYQAPAAIIYRETSFGIRQPDQVFLGGIYLERANPKVARIYEKQTAEQGPRRSLLTWAVKIPRNGVIPREPIDFQLKG
jgi:uncharacterized protein YcfL